MDKDLNQDGRIRSLDFKSFGSLGIAEPDKPTVLGSALGSKFKLIDGI